LTFSVFLFFLDLERVHLFDQKQVFVTQLLHETVNVILSDGDHALNLHFTLCLLLHLLAFLGSLHCRILILVALTAFSVFFLGYEHFMSMYLGPRWKSFETVLGVENGSELLNGLVQEFHVFFVFVTFFSCNINQIVQFINSLYKGTDLVVKVSFNLLCLLGLILKFLSYLLAFKEEGIEPACLLLECFPS
jgi:hypothetical protein